MLKYFVHTKGKKYKLIERRDWYYEAWGTKYSKAIFTREELLKYYRNK